MEPARIRSRHRFVVLAASLVGALTLTACGSQDAKIPPPLTIGSINGQLAMTPPGLTPAERRLDRAANTVLPGDGQHGLQQLAVELAALRGTPVVVNVWGDWCVPCRKEMPVVQRVALAHRGRVAFLGVATLSSRAKTLTFLTNRIALPFPSVLDDSGEVAGSAGVSNVPQTFFYTGAGKRTVHLGPYEATADLDADIKRYALS